MDNLIKKLLRESVDNDEKLLSSVLRGIIYPDII